MDYFKMVKTAGFQKHLRLAREKLAFNAPMMDVGQGFGSGITPQVGAAMTAPAAGQAVPTPKKSLLTQPKKKVNFRQQAPGSQAITPQAAEGIAAGTVQAPAPVSRKVTPAWETASGKARGAVPVSQKIEQVAAQRAQQRTAQTAAAARKANMSKLVRRGGAVGLGLGGLGLATYGVGRMMGGGQQKAASAPPTEGKVRMAAFFDELQKIASS